MARANKQHRQTGADPFASKSSPPLPNPESSAATGSVAQSSPVLPADLGNEPGLTIASVVLRLTRALLPVITLYVGKLIIDEALRLVGLHAQYSSALDWYESGQLTYLFVLLSVEFGLAILADVSGRVVALIDSLLSEKFNNDASVRLMKHAATLDLEDFEDSEMQDKIDRARRLTMGRMTLMSQMFGQAQDMITVLSFAAGLMVYAPWLIVLLVVALVPAFLGEAHFNALSYSLNFAWTPERRELEYVRLDRDDRGDRERNQDIRPQRISYRPLPPACGWLLFGQPRAFDQTRGLGQPALRTRHARLLCRLCLHRLGNHPRRRSVLGI